MASEYSNSLKTHYFEPRVDITNRIVEFRLDYGGNMYLPSMRIVGLGFTSVGANCNPVPVLGQYSHIRNIRLLDGGVELGNLREANRFLSFQSQLSENMPNLCVNSVLSRNRVGYVMEDTSSVEYPSLDKFSALTGGNLKDGTKILQAADGVRDAYLELKKVFPILGQLPALDTAVFKQLKILIEYDTDVRMNIEGPVKLGGVAPADTEITAINTKPPTLIADEVIDDRIKDSLRREVMSGQYVYDEIEHDQFDVNSANTAEAAAVAAAANTTTVVPQTTDAVINAFDQHVVSRMVLMKAYRNKDEAFHPATAAQGKRNLAKGNGNYNSLYQLDEKLQIRVNGSNLFSGEGIVGEPQKAHLLSHAWGTLNVMPFTNRGGIGLDDPDSQSVNTEGAPSNDGRSLNGQTPAHGTDANRQSDFIGGSNYIGFSVEDRVARMQFRYQRALCHDTSAADLNRALTVHIFAEVRKMIQMNGGAYKIAYM